MVCLQEQHCRDLPGIGGTVHIGQLRLRGFTERCVREVSRAPFPQQKLGKAPWPVAKELIPPRTPGFLALSPGGPRLLNSTVFFIYVIVITHIIRFVSFSRLYEMRKLCTLSCASKDLAMRTLSSYLSLNLMPIDYQTGNRS